MIVIKFRHFVKMKKTKILCHICGDNFTTNEAIGMMYRVAMGADCHEWECDVCAKFNPEELFPDSALADIPFSRIKIRCFAPDCKRYSRAKDFGVFPWVWLGKKNFKWICAARVFYVCPDHYKKGWRYRWRGFVPMLSADMVALAEGKRLQISDPIPASDGEKPI